MVGLERSVLPLVGEDDFGLTSTSAILAFVVAFGLAKALANLVAGGLADRVGRRRLLILGWVLALPVPLLIGVAPIWGFVVAANLFLGASQGFAWSMTVVMKIDLVGPSGAASPWGSTNLPATSGSRSPHSLRSTCRNLRAAHRDLGWGLVVATLGLAISTFFVRDTGAHVSAEQRSHGHKPAHSLGAAFARGTTRDPVLRACSQAGLVNNLNDALAWGLAPLYLAANGAIDLRGGCRCRRVSGCLGCRPARSPAGCRITSVASRSSSRGCWCRRARSSYSSWVEEPSRLLSSPLRYSASGRRSSTPRSSPRYPTRCSRSTGRRAVGVYRFWRDIGFVAGTLVSGAVADAFGAGEAIAVVAALTAGSGLWVAATSWTPYAGRPHSPGKE